MNDRQSTPSQEYSDVPYQKKKKPEKKKMRKGNSTANLHPVLDQQLNRTLSGIKKHRRSAVNLKSLDKVVEPILDLNIEVRSTKSGKANLVSIDDIDSEDEFRP